MKLALLAVLAALVLIAGGGGLTVLQPAAAREAAEPDQELIDDIWSYARETQHGYVHVLRWMRTLQTFGALESMTADEAQAYADVHIGARWNPVVEELRKLESASGDHVPDQQVIADVRGYAQETHYGSDHVWRWMRTLKALGALEDMSAAEAQGYADQGWQRWVPVAAALAELEAAAAAPNLAPLVNEQAERYADFTATGNAPRGVLVSKPFAGIFSDPDGDQLTYSVSLPGDRMPLTDMLLIHERFQRVFFQADAEDDWEAVTPSLPNHPVATVTLTATDPDGLSASISGDFLILWEPACELPAPSSVSGLGIARAAVISWTVPEGQSRACEATGFRVGATNSDGESVEALIDDPMTRRHVLRGLDPGDYRFDVYTEYDEGVSASRVGPRQAPVPATCSVTLTVKPYSRNAISGRWTNNANMPNGCTAGGKIELHYKRTSDDHYQEYGRFPNTPQTDPDLPAFIMGGYQPYVGYDFKIVAVDAAGVKHESNAASATIVSEDPSVTADANSPGDVRVYADNNSGAIVSWGLPTTPAGHTLSAYVVEWKTGSAAAMTAEVPSSTISESEFVNRGRRLTGLTDTKAYTVRVAARFTDDATMATSDAWSAPAPSVTAWSEPTQVWFTDGTPRDVGGRIFMISDTNKNWAVIVCHWTSDGSPDLINCPKGTLVHAEASGAISARAVHTIASVETRSAESDGVAGGPGAPEAYASGGNGRLAVAWGTAASNRAVGTLDAYIIQRRKQNADMTWPNAWTDTVITDTAKRTHTLTGLTNGTWQVRVRGRSDGNDSDPNTADTARLGFTSDVRTVTLHILHTQPPLIPNGVEVTPGSQSLVVEWEPPEASQRRGAAHAYQVRHWLRGSGEAYTETYTESAWIYPHPTRRMCSAGECENPRRYVISGLTAGKQYDVEVRARNAVGESDWVRTYSFNIPNN